MNKLHCVKTKKLQNPEVLANAIYNNFVYLNQFPELMHTKEEILKTLTEKNNIIYLVYDGHKLIGYLVADIRFFPDNRYGCYISYFYVSQKYRGKKIGSKLLEKLIQKCRYEYLNSVVLTCDTHDTNLVKFYQKYNFIPDEVLGGSDRRHNVFSLFL